jgi:hypothetical protein
MRLSEILTIKLKDIEWDLVGNSLDGLKINTPNISTPTQEQIDAWKDELSYIEIQNKRRIAYINAGIEIEQLAVALWEIVVENRPDSANIIQKQRELIKSSIPLKNL